MPQRSRPPQRLPPRAANGQTSDPPLRIWAVRIIRKRAVLLGYVDAPDNQAAEDEVVRFRTRRIERALARAAIRADAMPQGFALRWL